MESDRPVRRPHAPGTLPLAYLAVFFALPVGTLLVQHADINAVVEAAIGGQSAGDLYEKSTDRHFPITVRLRAAQAVAVEAAS